MVMLKVYLVDGKIFEDVYTSNGAAAVELSEKIIQEGWSNTCDGITTYYPANQIKKVEF